MLNRLTLIFVFAMASVSQAAILIEDGKAHKTSAENQSASDGLAMRKVRRAAIGATAAGPLGLLGANLELNFTSRWGFGAGYGGSPKSYQAYTFQVKHVLAGESLLPYMAFGYAKWYTTGTPDGPVGETNPAFLAQKFLNDNQKRSGDFAVHLIYPSFGLQYMVLSGPYSGYSVFAEVVVLIEVESFEAVPTGTLGFLYYF